MATANQMEKWRAGDAALDLERKRMADALARIRHGAQDVRVVRSPARIMIGLDLTASREHALKQARIAMAGMLDVMKQVGRFMVKTVYYRGMGECRETQGWTEDIDGICQSMLKLTCEAGGTKIGRILQRALSETQKLDAVIFIGDHCEETPGELLGLATSLGGRKVPVFVFHECADWDNEALGAKTIFKRIAQASGGLYTEFKTDSGETLKEMLASIAAYSSQGIEGISRLSLPQTEPARRLRQGLQLMPGSGTNNRKNA